MWVLYRLCRTYYFLSVFIAENLRFEVAHRDCDPGPDTAVKLLVKPSDVKVLLALGQITDMIEELTADLADHSSTELVVVGAAEEATGEEAGSLVPALVVNITKPGIRLDVHLDTTAPAWVIATVDLEMSSTADGDLKADFMVFAAVRHAGAEVSVGWERCQAQIGDSMNLIEAQLTGLALRSRDVKDGARLGDKSSWTGAATEPAHSKPVVLGNALLQPTDIDAIICKKNDIDIQVGVTPLRLQVKPSDAKRLKDLITITDTIAELLGDNGIPASPTAGP